MNSAERRARFSGSPEENRTPATALRGRRPVPLDYGATLEGTGVGLQHTDAAHPIRKREVKPLPVLVNKLYHVSPGKSSRNFGVDSPKFHRLSESLLLILKDTGDDHPMVQVTFDEGQAEVERLPSWGAASSRAAGKPARYIGPSATSPGKRWTTTGSETTRPSFSRNAGSWAAKSVQAC